VVEWDSGKVIGNNHGVLHCSMESFRLITTRAGHACRSHPFLVIVCVVESIFRYEDPIIPPKSVRSSRCLETFQVFGSSVNSWSGRFCFRKGVGRERACQISTNTSFHLAFLSSLVSVFKCSIRAYHRLVFYTLMTLMAGCVYWSLQWKHH
jgi:hypothetical protein